MYEDLTRALRKQAHDLPEKFSRNAENIDLFLKAADAIEELSQKYIEERNAAVELTGELASKNRWIPVTERLPETGVDVLVMFPHNMAVASRDIGEWVVNSGDGWCTDVNLSDDEKEPTHWMPLPTQPPKEETE